MRTGRTTQSLPKGKTLADLQESNKKGNNVEYYCHWVKVKPLPRNDIVSKTKRRGALPFQQPRRLKRIHRKERPRRSMKHPLFLCILNLVVRLLK